ncbi:hypothetical protein JXB31_02870 [Candidatus Woesearchaeota archaeon]|nr:hypothetical protein [Candidatus Woesearchaeota archaeon]
MKDNYAENEELEEDMIDPDTEERDVYKKETRDELVENDEISPEEEGFMDGYDSDYDQKSASDEELD